MAQKKAADSSVNVRKLALDLMIEIMEENVFCDKALHHALDSTTLTKRDRSFLTRLVEGTIERCIEIDYILNQFSKVRVAKMKPVIRNILRLAVYQIFYMDQVPDSAACNEAVKLTVKRKLSNLKGFVNGVLRSISREKAEISYPPREDVIAYFSVCYSMPEWIVEEFLKTYGEKGTEQILQSFLKEKKGLAIRCTQSRFSKEQVRKALEKEGVLVEDGELLPYALSISGYSSLKELTAFQKGMFQVQDESSMLAGQIAGIRQDSLVLDVCAAPGGKTLHAADICIKGQVISCDLTKEKTELIRENCVRLGYDNIQIFQNDATVLREEWIDKADVVIADLPCSGLGVIGKKCDIKYKTTREDILALAKVQRQILSVVSKYVKPGGRLVFSTCTIVPEENQENAEWIEKNLGLEPVSIEESLPERLKGISGEKGYLQILPNMADTDGFFISCFRKRGNM